MVLPKCPEVRIRIAGTDAFFTCNGNFRLQCIGVRCHVYPCDTIKKFTAEHAGDPDGLFVQECKVTVVGEPMTINAFGKHLKDMYKEDEDGVPLWKITVPIQIFGVKEVKNGPNKPE